jgi:hypothetical protein
LWRTRRTLRQILRPALFYTGVFLHLPETARLNFSDETYRGESCPPAENGGGGGCSREGWAKDRYHPQAMQDHCAVFRTANVLEERLRKRAEIAQALDDLSVTDRSMIWNTDLVEAL